MDDVVVTVNVFERPSRRWRLEAIGPVSERTFLWPLHEGRMIAVITDTQKVAATWGSPVDRAGHPAPIQAGTLVWKTSLDGVVTVAGLTEDPVAVTITAAAPGACEVWPEADADLGDGVSTIVGEHLAVQVTAGMAVGFGPPSVGTPEEL